MPAKVIVPQLRQEEYVLEELIFPAVLSVLDHCESQARSLQNFTRAHSLTLLLVRKSMKYLLDKLFLVQAQCQLSHHIASLRFLN